jgi:hypothetical protein
MTRQIVLLLIFDYLNQKVLDERYLRIIELPKGIEHLMRKQNRLGQMRIGFNHFLNGSIGVDIFELKDRLVSESDLLLWVDQLLVVLLLFDTFHQQQTLGIYSFIILNGSLLFAFPLNPRSQSKKCTPEKMQLEL